MRLLGLAALVVAALASGGCLVLAFNPIYDDATIEFDEKLLGTWEHAEDGTSAVITRGPWRSYDIAYSSRGSTLKLSGFVTRIGEGRFLDIAPGHGVDPAPLTVATHAVLRMQLLGDTLSVSGFDYAWWMRAATQGTLGKLRSAVDERKNLVLTSPTPVLREWIAGSLTTDEVYDDPLTFARKR
jgi:hypothetical protein